MRVSSPHIIGVEFHTISVMLLIGRQITAQPLIQWSNQQLMSLPDTATQLPSSSMFDFLSENIRPLDLPPGFPQSVASPKYQIGERCRWIPTQNTDWGSIIGHVYLPRSDSSYERPQWSWIYLILLDADSPSRDWIAADWVGEEDLEILPEQAPSVSTELEAL